MFIIPILNNLFVHIGVCGTYFFAVMFCISACFCIGIAPLSCRFLLTFGYSVCISSEMIPAYSLHSLRATWFLFEIHMVSSLCSWQYRYLMFCLMYITSVWVNVREKPKEAITNGQSRDTVSIENTGHRTKITKTK